MKSLTKETVKSLQVATKRAGQIVKKSGFTAQQLAGFGIQKKYEVVIGIDPGTHTGVAIKYTSTKLFSRVETLTIYKAIKLVEEWSIGDVFCRIEDARQRVWFGNTGKERLKGAGSVERDCAIWEEVLTSLNIPFEMVHPKNVKETTAEFFAKISGWKGRTSKHSREAAWLILNF